LDVPEFVEVVGCCCGVGLVGVGFIPDAANAAAGATVRITGTLQPALSMVRRENTDPRSGNPPSFDSEFRRGSPSSKCLFI
jgi:hypothetical protein